MSTPPNFWSPFHRSHDQTSTTEVGSTRSNALQALAGIAAEYDFVHFCLTGFCQWVEQKRQRHIVVIGWSMPVHVYGAWLTHGQHDFVFFDKATIPLHQAHIQLHELAHILLGHETLDLSRERGLC